MPTPPQFGRRGVAATPAAPAYGAAPPKNPAPQKREPAAASGPSPLAPMLRLFFSFDGRLRRRDYWLTQLVVSALMYLGLWFELSVLPGAKGNLAALLPLSLFSMALPIVSLWSLLATQVKRWHDRGKSGWWFLIGFIPFVGGLWAFIELGCLDGDAGDNAFGPSPKWSPDVVFA
jgi:uncharacterized membrane protein YhaH (DUF805 family)